MQSIFSSIFFLLLLASCSSLQKTGSGVGESGIDDSKNSAVLTLDQIEKKVGEYMKIAIEKPNTPEYQKAIDTLILMGNDYSFQGVPGVSSYIFEQVALIEKSEYLLQKLAFELVSANEMGKAELVIKEILSLKNIKNRDQLGVFLAGIYSATGRPALAHEEYAKVLKVNPKNEEACLYYSRSLFIKGEEKKADRVLTKCERHAPKIASFSYFKGKFDQEKNRDKEAIAHFKKSLKIDDSYYQSAHELGLIYEESNPKKARRFYEKYLDRNPYSQNIVTRYVHMLFQAQEFSKAIPYLETLVTMDPSDLDLKMKLGILYEDNKRSDEAIGIYKEILEVIPDADRILFFLGSIYAGQRKLEEAYSYFSKVPPESEYFEESHKEMARLLQVGALQDMSEKGIERLVSFVKTRSEKYPQLAISLYTSLAGYYEIIGKNSDAATTIEELVTVKEGDVQEEIFYYLASLYDKNRDYKKSEKLLKRIIKENPENSHALNFLGYSYLERGVEMDQAYKFILKASQLNPEDGYILDSLGWYYYKVGNFEKALDYLEKANKLVKNDMVITKHLGMVHREMNNFKLAMRYFQKALEKAQHASDKTLVLKEIERLEAADRIPASD